MMIGALDAPRRQVAEIDYALLWSVLILLFTGLVFVYSASIAIAEGGAAMSVAERDIDDLVLATPIETVDARAAGISAPPAVGLADPRIDAALGALLLRGSTAPVGWKSDVAVISATVTRRGAAIGHGPIDGARARICRGRVRTNDEHPG